MVLMPDLYQTILNWLGLIVSVVIVTVVLYISTRIVTKEEVLTTKYALRLIITALVAVILVPFVEVIFPIGMLAILVAFLVLVIIIRVLVIPAVSLGEEWVEAIIVAFLTVILIYVLNWILSLASIKSPVSLP